MRYTILCDEVRYSNNGHRPRFIVSQYLLFICARVFSLRALAQYFLRIYMAFCCVRIALIFFFNTCRSRSGTPSSFPGTPPQQHPQQPPPPPNHLHLHHHHLHHHQQPQQHLQQQQHNSNSSSSAENINQNSLGCSSGGGSGGPKPSDFQPRNYSDFIRSLAAKYNNNNPNE